MTVERFRNQENPYWDWLQSHPEGYVFNHFGSNDDDVNVLHRVFCKSLRFEHNEGRRTVYEKICGTDLEELISVIRIVRAERGWHRCTVCAST